MCIVAACSTSYYTSIVLHILAQSPRIPHKTASAWREMDNASFEGSCGQCLVIDTGYSNGSLPASYAGGCGFKSHPRIHRLGRDVKSAIYGSLVQTVRTPACHAGSCRFKSDSGRHKPLTKTAKIGEWELYICS